MLSGEVSAAGVDPFSGCNHNSSSHTQHRAVAAAFSKRLPSLVGRSGLGRARSGVPVRSRARLALGGVGISFARSRLESSRCAKHRACIFASAHACGIGNIGTVEPASRGRFKPTSRELENRNWEIDRLRERLLPGLDLPEGTLSGGELDIQVLKPGRDRKVLQSGSTANWRRAARPELSARAAEAEARDRVSGLEGRLRGIDGLISEVELGLPYMQAELPILFVEMDKADKPICRLCEAPIDRVLAEGCKLSNNLPDLAGAARRYETCQVNLAAQGKKLEDLRRERSALPADIALARQSHEQSSRNLRALEQSQDARSDEVFRARRLIDDVHRYEELICLRAQAKERADGNAVNVTRSRAVLETLRGQQGDVFRRLSGISTPSSGTLLVLR